MQGGTRTWGANNKENMSTTNSLPFTSMSVKFAFLHCADHFAATKGSL